MGFGFGLRLCHWLWVIEYRLYSIGYTVMVVQ